MLVAFSEGSAWGWTSAQIISLIAISIISMAIFIRRELKVSSPALDIRLFKFTKYTVSIVAISIVTMGLYAGTLLTPLYLQNTQHLSTLDTGLILLPPSLVMALMMPIVGTLYSRIDKLQCDMCCWQGTGTCLHSKIDKLRSDVVVALADLSSLHAKVDLLTP